MFERFSDRARRVVVLAQEEARLLNHNYIGTEHLLLGLIHEGEGVAARALESLDVDFDAIRHEVEMLTGRGGQAPSGHIPFTPRAKKVLEFSLREALQLGHNYIGTEHVLLGLIREGEGVAAQVLTKLGADLGVVRQRVIEILHSGGFTDDQPGGSPSSSLRFTGTGPVNPTRPSETCALCGRDLWDVLRYVETSQLAICDECVSVAYAALDVEASERAVTMPPRGFGTPPPTPDDLLEIQQLFASGLSSADTVEDGDQLVALVPIASTRHPGMQAKFIVERVRTLDRERAEVRYTAIVSPGGMRIAMAGRVIRLDGRWKMARRHVSRAHGEQRRHPRRFVAAARNLTFALSAWRPGLPRWSRWNIPSQPSARPTGSRSRSSSIGASSWDARPMASSWSTAGSRVGTSRSSPGRVQA